MTVNTKTKKRISENGGPVPDDVGLMVGRRLAEIRHSTGLDQVAFSEKIRTAQSTLSTYERGLVPQSWLTLRVLAEMGFDVNALLTGRR